MLAADGPEMNKGDRKQEKKTENNPQQTYFSGTKINQGFFDENERTPPNKSERYENCP